MERATRIGILGDFDSGNSSHLATNAALAHSADALSLKVDTRWIGTANFIPPGTPEVMLADFDALLCSPGSPYVSMEGALTGIRYARERNIPFLGTCGGFQHALIEYARNVLGIADAEHEETAPDAKQLLIARLPCSLVGRHGSVRFPAGGKLREIMQCDEAVERFYCSFGVNPEFAPALRSNGLFVSAESEDGEIRAVELTSHPFFLGTLFIPQMLSQIGAPHPIINAFVKAAATR